MVEVVEELLTTLHMAVAVVEVEVERFYFLKAEEPLGHHYYQGALGVGVELQRMQFPI